jgi:hypothetical protein
MAEIFKAHDYTVSLSDPYGDYAVFRIKNAAMSVCTEFSKRDTFSDLAGKLEQMVHELNKEHRRRCIEAGIPDEEGSDAFGGDYAS